ncbi:MAG: hypothetical protein JSV12_09030 [Candidatus Bathyarchaeota archaeon]|nr:MAG: hypothetical protein JSV12_09030 [Candidatus Bathyarchaeota archaeon]
MNVSLEKTIIVLVVISFIFASANSFILHVPFITREEAIEISRRTELVQSYMEDADYYWLVEGAVRYLNQTTVNRAREEAPWLRDIYPKDGSVWIVEWSFRWERFPGGVIVGHVIDAETGQILDEGALHLR